MQPLSIRTYEHLAFRVNRPLSLLHDIASEHPKHYRASWRQIGRKKRRIFDPDRELRVVLNGIKTLLREIDIPPAIIGGRKGHTLRDFAEPHVGKPWVLKLDIKNFYPSTSHHRVRALFGERLGCSRAVAGFLTRLVTAEEHLPQGFNTSTDIGNLIISDTIARLSELAATHDLAVTVWVDNIVISGPGYLPRFRATAERIIRDGGFRLSESVLVPNSRPQTICGATVNSTVSFHKAKRDLLRAELHQIRMGLMCTVCEGDATKLRDNLRGRISAVRQYSSRQERALRHLFGGLSVEWDCRCSKHLPEEDVSSARE